MTAANQPRRVAGALAALALSGALTLAGAPAASPQGIAVPGPTDEDTEASSWSAFGPRDSEADSPVAVDLVSAPALSGAGLRAGTNLTVTLRVHNTSDERIDDLTLTPQRADAAFSPAQAREALAAASTSYGYYGGSTELDPLAPGESREVSLTVATQPGADSTLSITDAGVYPTLFSLLGTNPATGASGVLTTERFLLPVTSPPEPEGGDEVPGLSLLYPVTAVVDITPGETGAAPQTQPLIMESEQLAGQLAPGGRLSGLLDVYAHSAPGAASCLAVDPELVDVVDRMSRGYTVGAEQRLPQRPERLRDSWGDDADEAGEPGTGAADAATWIAQLADIAATGCVIALPWAGADLDAAAATGDQWLLRETLERGPSTLSAILGNPGVTNTVVVPSGYVSPPTAAALGWADHSRSSVPDSGMTSAWEQSLANGPGQPSAAPIPAQTVGVLVADNSVWSDRSAGRFHTLAPGVMSAGYDSSLAATLAAAGEHPATVGYSDAGQRYPLTLDSPLSRGVTAAAALDLAVFAADDPVLAPLPLTLDPATAQRTLDAANGLLDSGRATALSLVDYVTPSAEELAALNDATALTDSRYGAEQPLFGSPFADPARYSDAEIVPAAQQAGYTDDLTRILSNDPALALTRYGYTLPLRRDQIRSLSRINRSAARDYGESIQRSAAILSGSGSALQQLRESIALLPPGNVYTRTSESSPLLIVAENRLPLPVEATISYSTPEDGARLDIPAVVRIPAFGSITTEMTAELPADAEQTEVRLWLATVDGSPISAPVDITVQTRGGSVVLFTGLGLLVLVLVIGVAARLASRRRSRPDKPADKPAGRPPDPS